MTTARTDTEFLLCDLAAHGAQTSWDWDADLRFAEHAGMTDLAARLRALIRAGNMVAINEWDATIRPTVTSRRLRGLRKLARSGAVAASWEGLGAGGGSFFGTNRVRVYELAGV